MAGAALASAIRAALYRTLAPALASLPPSDGTPFTLNLDPARLHGYWGPKAPVQTLSHQSVCLGNAGIQMELPLSLRAVLAMDDAL